MLPHDGDEDGDGETLLALRLLQPRLSQGDMRRAPALVVQDTIQWGRAIMVLSQGFRAPSLESTE